MRRRVVSDEPYDVLEAFAAASDGEPKPGLRPTRTTLALVFGLLLETLFLIVAMP